MDGTTLFLLACVFSGGLIQSTFGFGNALLMMPSLTLVVSLNLATPLVALCSSTLHILILAKHWKRIDVKAAWRLVLASLVGIPIGASLLTNPAFEVPLKLFLAFLIIGFSLFILSGKKTVALKNDRLAWLFGWVSGVLGGAYNTNGPAVILFGNLRGWEPDKFRVTLQGYFFPVGLMVLGSHYVSGLWTEEVWQTYLLALPALLIGTGLGMLIHNRIPAGRFQRYVYYLLILLGVLLAGNTILKVLE